MVKIYKNKQEETYSNETDNEPKTYLVEGMSIGMCIGIGIGTTIGAAINNIGVCMCFGLSIGMSLGLAIGSIIEKDTNNNETEK